MLKLLPSPKRVPAASVFSTAQTDEEVLAAVIAHYFAPEELAQARHIAESTASYEEAIRYLVKQGQGSMRDSAEERAPRVYITIPGGRVLIHHPARLFPEPTIYALSVTHLALQAFPPPPSAGNPTETEQQAVPTVMTPQLLFFDESMQPASQPAGDIPPKSSRKKPQKCVFVEQSIRIGTKHLFWTRSGWVVKKGFLGYVPTKIPSGAYRVELVHLVSYWVMADTYLDTLDDLAHERLQGWVSDAHALTDWSRGINAILKEKTGKDKKWAWSTQLKDLWHVRRQEPRQLSFF